MDDVWVCSGQSNMAFEVQDCMNAKHEIKLAKYPEIKYFQVKRVKADKTLSDMSPIEGTQPEWVNKWQNFKTVR